MNLTILGGGAWGTALAASVAGERPTVLWVRTPEAARALGASRRNDRYLPGVTLPAALGITSDFAEAVAHAAGGLIIVATPIAALAELLARLAALQAPAGVLWLCKGFQLGTGWMGHEIARSLGIESPVGVLSGPSFALEVARGQPTALVAASHDAHLAEQVVAALHHGGLRIYTSDDPVGVEVGGAVKNVIAIATGIADGMAGAETRAGTRNGTGTGVGTDTGTGSSADNSAGAGGLGLNARAALITRGLAEMTRLGMALGARPETFMGLSGLGDLVLTATGELSRNRQVGRLLAQGQPLERILGELGHVAEGVASAPMVLRRARALGVDMPIAEAVVDVLEGRVTPAAALERLMGREARPEKNWE